MSSLSSRLSRALDGIEKAILSGGILGMAGLTVLNVLSRSLAGRSLAAAEELCQFALVWVTFFGISHAAAQGRHIRMSALYDTLRDSIRRRVRVAICLLTGALLAVLALFGVFYVQTVGSLGTVTPVLQVPLWLVYLAAPTGLGLAALQYGLAAWRNLRSESAVYLSYSVADSYHPIGEGI